MSHEPTGCVLIHPFTLRPDVDWAKEPKTFSLTKWEYTGSPAMHREFRRFQYSSLVGLVLPIMYWFADFVYTFLYELDLNDPWIQIFLALGVVWMILIPLDIVANNFYAHQLKWTRIRMAVEVLTLVNSALFAGPFAFHIRYNNCQSLKDSLLGMFGRTPEEYGWTPRRNELYCQQVIEFLMGVTALFVPVTTNLPPVGVFVYLAIRFVNEIANRPIFYATGYYDPPEHPAQLTTKLLALIMFTVFGFWLFWLRSAATRRHFEQAVMLTADLQEANAQEESVDTLLCATVPASALARLAANQPCSDFTPSASVLFSDMKGFTAWSSKRLAEEVVVMLNIVTEAIDLEAVKLNVEKVKTIGDGYWAVTGLPEEMNDHALTMCQFGKALLRVARAGSDTNPEWGDIQFRVGIHSGPLNGGILGTKMISYEVFGETSDVASKMEQIAAPNMVCISAETKEEADLQKGECTEHTEVDHKGTTYPSFLLVLDRLPGLGARAIPSLPSLGRRSMNGSSNGSQRPARRTTHDFSASLDSMPYEVDHGKSRRRAFLQQKARAQGKKDDFNRRCRSVSPSNTTTLAIGGDGETDTDSLHDNSPEAIKEKYTTRKWRFLLTTLADLEAECAFTVFSLKKQKTLRIACRWGLLAVPLITFFAVAIEQSFPGAKQPNAGLLVFLFLATITATVDLSLLYATSFLKKGDEWPVLQMILTFATCILALLSSMVAEPGTSVATNDAAWMGIAFISFSMFGNGGGVIGTLWLVLLECCVLWPFIWASCWRNSQLSLNRTVEVQVLAASGLLLAMFERQYRQQFYEVQLQEHAHRDQLEIVAEQDALLKSIVPEHIAGALLTWMSGDMKTPLVRSYENSVIGFLHLLPPQRSPEISLVSPPALPPLPHACATVTTDPFDGTATTATDHHVLLPGSVSNEGGPLDDMAEVTIEHWLAHSVTQVDELLAQHPAISKIKTIGDIVMLAGPFGLEEKKKNGGKKDPPENDGISQLPTFECVQGINCRPEDVQLAVLQLVRVSEALAEIGGGVHCGIHCGPVVGAIQGTSRLCFDMFGDTVNTASRVMSGCAQLRPGAASFCAVSEVASEVLKCALPRSQLEEVEVVAKGKGMLTAFFVS